MTRCIVVLFIFIVLSPVAAQSPEVEWDFPVITAENAHNLGIVRTVYSRDFPAEYRFQYATPFLFHPDGRRMVIALEKHPGLIDLQTGETSVIVQEDKYSVRLFNMRLSQDGRLLLTPDELRFILWDIETQNIILQEKWLYDTGVIGAATISSDNQFLFMRVGFSILVWDIEQKQEIDRYEFNCLNDIFYYDYAVCDLRDTTPRSIAFVDLRTGDTIAIISPNNWWGLPSSQYISLSPDRHIMTIVESNRRYSIIDLLNREFVQHVDTTDLYEGGLANYSINPSGNLVVRLHNKNFEIMDIFTGDVLMTVPSQISWHYNYLQFSPDGKFFAIGDFENNAIDVYAVTECQITARRVVYPRSAPGLSDDRGTIQPDKRMAVVAQEFDPVGGYLWYQLADGRWIQANIVETSGNCEDETQ